ncbi:condensation domain-containing protein [Sphingobium sufflavum]|uniref:condensation domain-containing protein n=1 Tax=Sphingobium sufflavum TaxID=1129547 RepID=UPI001F2910C9|nr:condensation domain-containing protein [Sphingobium sufflavum]MCE7797246.1 condensation domain-containing protein [Sphingobium sufflavum]
MHEAEKTIIRARKDGISFRLSGRTVEIGYPDGPTFPKDYTDTLAAAVQELQASYLAEWPATGLSMQQRMTDIGLRRFLMGSNNMIVAMAIEGAVDPDAVEHVTQTIVACHGALRTRYFVPGHECVGLVGPAAADLVEVIPVAGSMDDDRIEALLTDASPWAFDELQLTDPVHLRGRLYRGEDRSVLILRMPHFVADGNASEILYREWTRLFHQPDSRDGTDQTRSNYDEFVRRQGVALIEGDLLDDIDDWQHVYRNTPSLRVPDRYRPVDGRSGHDNAQIFTLDAGQIDAIRAIARQERLTPESSLFALLGLALGRWSGQSSLLIPTMYHGRDTRSAFMTMGLYLVGTLLPIACPPGDDLMAVMRSTSARWTMLTRFGGIPSWLALLDVMDSELAMDSRRTLIANILVNMVPGVQSINTVETDRTAIAPIRRLRLPPPRIADPSGGPMYLLVKGDSTNIVGTIAYNSALVSEAGINDLRAIFADILAESLPRTPERAEQWELSAG